MHDKISYRSEVLRKLIHLSSMWMVLAIYVLDREQAIVLFALLMAGMSIFEVLRRLTPLGRRLTQKFMGKILRPHETAPGHIGLTGAFYVVLSVLLALMLFSKTVVMAALAVMLLADTAAALIGRRYGKKKILDKSAEGCAAYFVVATAVLSAGVQAGMGLPWYAIPLVALGSTLTELFSKKLRLDDNLTITLGTAALLQLFL
jgi:dolichol kinase